ncbi:hypothetical protein EIP86_005606 [Pleurotus ostreatoroseus]|nr:hypothetical protein EIP86_005606 [Pleurotus ostreatoroseus]
MSGLQYDLQAYDNMEPEDGADPRTSQAIDLLSWYCGGCSWENKAYSPFYRCFSCGVHSIYKCAACGTMNEYLMDSCQSCGQLRTDPEPSLPPHLSVRRWGLPEVDYHTVEYTYEGQNKEHPARAFITGLLLAIQQGVTTDPVMGPSLEVEVRWLDEIIPVVQGSGYAAEVPPVENSFMVEDYIGMVIVWWDKAKARYEDEVGHLDDRLRDYLGVWKHLFLGYNQDGGFDRTRYIELY